MIPVFYCFLFLFLFGFYKEDYYTPLIKVYTLALKMGTKEFITI